METMAKEPASGKLDVALLYDDSLDNNNGVTQYIKTLGAWLTKHGHQVTYLVGESKVNTWAGAEVYSLSKNLKVSWGGNRLSMSLIPKLKTIKRVLKDKHFDVVHVQFPYSPFMAQLVIKASLPRVATVATVHVYPAHRLASTGSRMLKKIYGQSLHRIDSFISVSQAAQQYAKSIFKKESQILPNVVDLANFSHGRAQSKKKYDIVFLGRLVRRKGPLPLLRAYLELSQSRPKTELIIAGDGPLRAKLEKFVKKHTLTKKVKFLGYIDEADKAELLVRAKIACFPSLYGESFGIVLTEAMAAGSDVVLGGDNEGYRSVLGFEPLTLIDPRHSKHFAQRLALLLDDAKLTADIHKQQSAEVAKYDIALVGPQIVEIYRQAIAKRAQGRHN